MDRVTKEQQVGELKDKLAKEKLYLEEEIRTDHDFEEIVGENAGLEIGDVRQLDREQRIRQRHRAGQRHAQVRLNCSSYLTRLRSSPSQTT